MREQQVDFRVERRLLRRHPAGPEHRHETVGDALGRRPEERPREIGADRVRVADVDRCAVVEREPARHLRRADRLLRREPAHRDDHVAAEAPGRDGRDRRAQHPAVLVGRHAGALERVVEGDSRSDQEGHEIVPPQRAEVGDVVEAFARAVDRVARQVDAQVGAGREPLRLRIARIADLEHRAGAVVALAVEQEVERVRARHDREVALDVAHGEAAGRAGVALLADVAAGGLCGRHSSQHS